MSAKKKLPGRPPKYTPDKLQIKINEYFMDCENKKKMPNLASLAVFLDVSRETVYEFKNNITKGFSDIIKKARLKIESLACERLSNNNSIGSMFYLKCAFGYKDKSEVEIKHKGNISVNILRFEGAKVGGDTQNGASK